jgi:PAS domain S-box-containing protein
LNRPPEQSWQRHRRRRVVSLAVFVLIVTVPLFANELFYATISPAQVMIWVGCLGLFVLADHLAGRIEDGHWGGYLNLSLMVAWLTVGPGSALILALLGVTISAAYRRYAPPGRASARAVIELALGRLAITGTALLTAAAIYAAAGGVVPIHEANLSLWAAILALLAGAITTEIAGQFLYRSDHAPEPLWKPGQRQRLLNELLLVVIILPLALVAMSGSTGAIAFMLLLALVGSHALRHHHNNRTRQALTRRVRELSLLSEAGHTLSASLLLDEVLLRVYKCVSQLVDAPLFYIALYDQNRNDVEYAFVARDSQRIEWPGVHVGDDPLLDTIVRTRTTLHIDPAYDIGPAHLLNSKTRPEPFHSYVGIPLMTGTKLIGIMGVVNGRDAAAGALEPRILEAVANQAGLAIRNAVLHNRSLQLATNLAHINLSVQDVMFNLDGSNAMQAACQTALQITEARKAAIFLLDEDNKSLSRLVHSTGMTEEHRRLYDGPIHRPDIYYGEPRIVPDIARLDERDALVELAQAGQFRALAEIPLKSGNTLVGLLAVFHDTPHYYHTTELELLETLAYQVAAALDNTELLGALELYASEQAQLVHLSRISTSSLEPETVIDLVTRMLKQMLGVDNVSIGLLNNGRTELAVFRPTSDGIQQQIVAAAEVAEVQAMCAQQLPGPRIYYRQDGIMSSAFAGWLEDEGNAMTALVPMIVNQDLLGIIFLSTAETRYFTDGEWRLIEMATNQIGTQLHNARLYRFTQDALNRRLQQLSLIEDIARQISSTLNMEQLIRNVLEAAIRATQAELAALGLKTESGGLRIIGQENLDGEWHKYEFLRQDSDGLMGRVLRSGEALIIDDNNTMPEYIAVECRGTYLSSLIIPLMKEDAIIGVLNVESTVPGFFNDERTEFVKNLAGHAVISIQNAWLLEERQAQIETLTKLRELSLRLSSDTDRKSVARAVARTALDILQGQNAAIFGWEPAEDELRLLGSLRRRDDHYVDAYTILPHSVALRAAHTGEIQIIEDVRQSQDFITFEDFAAVNYISLIAAPIQHGNRVREVLCVTLPRQRPYGESDRSKIDLLAIQAAGHLENANLYEHIRTNSDRMRAILDSTRDGIILLDRQGRLIEANISAQNMLNVDLETHLDRNFADTLLTELEGGSTQNPSLHDALTEMARILRLEPQRITSRALEVRRGNKTRYIEEVGSPVFDSRNHIMGRLLTLRDVTEERLLEGYRDEISHMVVHDLRGPLGSIISSITLTLETTHSLVDTETAGEIVPLMEVSLDSAVSLLQLVDSLLDIAKLETRRMPLKRTPTSVQELATGAFLTLSSSIQEAQVIVDLDIPDNLPQVDVDADKIRRVLINLLDNAVRFTPSDCHVLISASLAGSRKVVVRVADSGPGVPPAESDYIFEKFRQVKSSVPLHGRKGSGLGLTFCKLAVEAHGETIWIESTSALPGACFAFTLPVSATGSLHESAPLHAPEYVTGEVD